MLKNISKNKWLIVLLIGTIVLFYGVPGLILKPSGKSAGKNISQKNFKAFLSNPEGIIYDPDGYVWMTNYQENSVTKLDANGKWLSPPAGFKGGGLNRPLGIVVDLNGHVWVANYGNNSITELDSTGKPISPPSGYQIGGLVRPYAIALDSTGNIWIANEGNQLIQLSPMDLSYPVVITQERSDGLNTLLPNGEIKMETLNSLGAEMLPNELTLLKVILGIGFAGWMMLILVQVVWLDRLPLRKSGLDEYGGHYSKKHGGYHCVTGRFAGKIFQTRADMLKKVA